MWGGRYWGKRYFGGRFWGPVVNSTPPSPTEVTQYGYWANRYWGGRYFGKRYWPGAGFGSSIPPADTAVPNVKIDLDKHLFRYPTVEQQLYALRKRKEELEETSRKIEAAGAYKAEQDRKLKELNSLKKTRLQKLEALRLEGLRAKAQEEIERLFIEKKRLLRLKDDEETLIVLFSMPFMT